MPRSLIHIREEAVDLFNEITDDDGRLRGSAQGIIARALRELAEKYESAIYDSGLAYQTKDGRWFSGLMDATEVTEYLESLMTANPWVAVADEPPPLNTWLATRHEKELADGHMICRAYEQLVIASPPALQWTSVQWHDTVINRSWLPPTHYRRLTLKEEAAAEAKFNEGAGE